MQVHWVPQGRLIFLHCLFGPATKPLLFALQVFVIYKEMVRKFHIEVDVWVQFYKYVATCHVISAAYQLMTGMMTMDICMWIMARHLDFLSNSVLPNTENYLGRGQRRGGDTETGWGWQMIVRLLMDRTRSAGAASCISTTMLGLDYPPGGLASVMHILYWLAWAHAGGCGSPADPPHPPPPEPNFAMQENGFVPSLFLLGHTWFASQTLPPPFPFSCGRSGCHVMAANVSRPRPSQGG